MAQQCSSRIKGAVMVRTEQQQDRLEAAITEEQTTVGAGAATTEHIDKENMYFLMEPCVIRVLNGMHCCEIYVFFLFPSAKRTQRAAPSGIVSSSYKKKIDEFF